MVYFLNSKVKTHAEDPLQYIFDENKEKIVVLGYSIVSRRSPLRVEVEPCSLVQVASSPSGDRVWARDREGGVWVRQAVYPELPCGTGWVAVSGLAAAWLEVSQRSVWVLAPGGRLYRRLGLQETDWVGRAWQEVPGPRGQVVVALSAGQCDTVWALDSIGGVHQLSVCYRQHFHKYPPTYRIDF